jgi:hypothetical protein
MLDISGDDSQFEQSLKFFEPPLEHHEDTLISNRERVKHKGGARPDQLLSDDSVLKQFIQNDVRQFNASKSNTMKSQSNKIEDTPDYSNLNPQSNGALKQDSDKFKKLKVVKKVGFEKKGSNNSLSEIFVKDG